MFEILALEPDENGNHCRIAALDSSGRSDVIEFARSEGVCSTCSGTGTITQGFTATIMGTLYFGTSPPTLMVSQILPTNAYCPSSHSTVPDPSLITCSSGGNLPAISAHEFLMLSSWGFLLPLGVLSAHFLRHRKNGLWFKIHRAVQNIGLLLATAGFIVAVINFDVFQGASPSSLAHGIIGVCVMSLGWYQPLNALLRPHATSPREAKSTARRRWELFHKCSGSLP